MGQYSDGLERDVTALSSFTLSDPNLATIDAVGILRPLGNGEAQLSAGVGEASAATTVRIESASQSRPFSFQRDIGEILTRRGCNAAECHGGVKGQGGFKLSRQTRVPRDDYTWIVEGGTFKVLTDEQDEPPQPRINREDPAQSLLLLKPTAGVAHGGGHVLEVGSPDYQTLLEWIRSGAPHGDEEGREAIAIGALEVEPPRMILEQGAGTGRLLVTARLSNGWSEDLTGRAHLEIQDPTVARLNAEGAVEAVGAGETSIIVSAPGHTITVPVDVVPAPVGDYPDPPPARNFIDEHVFAKLRRFGIAPSQLTGDAEFLRRVCLDLTGTLPPPDRVREFLADSNPNKRDKLIETLLNSPQFDDFWTYRFADLFRVYFSARTHNVTTHQYLDWVRQRVTRNEPYDQVARELIAAGGVGDATLHFYHHRVPRIPQELMVEQMRLFQGLRLECAQCHDHPSEAWTQDQFWGLAAFFSRLTVIPEPDGEHESKSMLIDLPPEFGLEPRKPLKHPRTQTLVQPAFPDGGDVAADGWERPRLAVGRWMTSGENPTFARAAVNRIWWYFFGRGIVEPVDDFRPGNPPTHPELLDALAEDFKDHGFDLKHLMRAIVQSTTYQLSSRANESNRDDLINYSRWRPRRLEAAVLLDAITRLTGIDEEFVIKGGRAPAGTRAVHLVPDMVPSRFLDVFGRSNRQGFPRIIGDETVDQALHMLSGSAYTDKISAPGGRVERLLKGGADDPAIIEELYLAALCRYPTDREQAELQALIAQGPSRKKSIEALTWALICSREFAYNP